MENSRRCKKLLDIAEKKKNTFVHFPRLKQYTNCIQFRFQFIYFCFLYHENPFHYFFIHNLLNGSSQ